MRDLIPPTKIVLLKLGTYRHIDYIAPRSFEFLGNVIFRANMACISRNRKRQRTEISYTNYSK